MYGESRDTNILNKLIMLNYGRKGKSTYVYLVTMQAASVPPTNGNHTHGFPLFSLSFSCLLNPVSVKGTEELCVAVVPEAGGGDDLHLRVASRLLYSFESLAPPPLLEKDMAF